MTSDEAGGRRSLPDDRGPEPGAERELDQLFLLHATALQAGDAAARWWFQLRADVQDATTEQSLNDILRNSLTGIAEALGADAVAILIADDSGELVVRAAVGLQPELWRQVHIAEGAGMAGRVLAERRPLVVDDLSRIDVASATLKDSGVRSLVAVPIATDDTVLGVVHADSFELAHFGVNDVRLLQVVADRLAAAIERVRLFQSERAARAHAEAAAERLGRLQRITAALSGDVDAHRVAEAVLAELAPEIGLDATSRVIWLVEGDRLRLLRDFESVPHASAFAEMRLDDPLPGPEVVRTGRPLWLSSHKEIEAYEALRDADVRSGAIAVLPLVVEARALGVLAVGYDQERDFGPEERIFLSVVAQQAADAFHRAELRAARAEVAAQNALLAELSATLGASLEAVGILQRGVRLLVPRLADMASVHVFDELGVLRRVALAHRDPTVESELLAGGQSSEYESRSVLAVLSEAAGEPLLLPRRAPDVASESALDQEHEEILRTIGIGSAIAVPLTARGEQLGLLGLTRLTGSAPYTEADVELGAEIGRRVSHAVDNALQHQRRIEVARALQASLLPPVLTPVPGAEVAAVFHPASTGVDVGGDFYDLFPLDGKRWVLMVGDVSGSGPAAAALTAQVRHGARVAARAGLAPTAVVGAVNSTLDETTGSEWFCTMVYAELVPHDDGIDLQVICAGHLPPLVVRAGEVEELTGQAPLLGVMPNATYRAQRVRLGPGHAMVLVTDGATEARPRGQHGLDSFFGEHRLREAVAAAAGRDAQGIVDAVAAAVLEFSGGQLGDDLALVALRAVPGARPVR